MGIQETLTARLWREITDVRAAIHAHPFITGLTDGSLPRASFEHYVVQDALYLRDYARALALCAAHAPHQDAVVMFCEHAAGAIAVERDLHDRFLADFGLDRGALDATEQSPACRAYTSYLLASCATGSYLEALAAVLPCYWIYADVGAALLARSSPDPLYARWIATYGGEEFAAIVAAALAEADRAGADVTDGTWPRVRERFVTTSRYEWSFWESGWRREGWPV